MKIYVSAKPRAKKEKVEKIDNTHFVVAVKESPTKGQANEALIKALADFLNIALSRLYIVFVHASRQKIVEIL